MAGTLAWGSITFEEPVLAAIREVDALAVDMHFHTDHSDAPTRVRDALALSAKKGIGVAITDHNEVSGVIEAEGYAPAAPVIPGIEISAADGPHILLYFYSVSELTDFYNRHIRKQKRESPYLATRLTSTEIIDAAEGWNCVRSAAHPYGYFFFIRGIQKCIEEEMLHPGIIRRFDAVEVICGTMVRSLNEKAAALASSRDMGITGGSDGHLLSDLGRVVTCARAEGVEEFLDAILKKQNAVIGRESTPIEKGIMGSIVATKYFRYLWPSLQIHWEQNLPRVERYLKK